MKLLGHHSLSESGKNRKMTRAVFSVIAVFVLLMSPNQILNLIYLIQVRINAYILFTLYIEIDRYKYIYFSCEAD